MGWLTWPHDWLSITHGLTYLTSSLTFYNPWVDLMKAPHVTPYTPISCICPACPTMSYVLQVLSMSRKSVLCPASPVYVPQVLSMSSQVLPMLHKFCLCPTSPAYVPQVPTIMSCVTFTCDVVSCPMPCHMSCEVSHEVSKVNLWVMCTWGQSWV